MPSDLYQRYMRATAAVRAHDAKCAPCTAGRRCAEGARLYESFDRLFAAYLNSLK
ncbi:hypothetical protein ACGFYE_39705 [Streptomyces zaomyceticus]|uniref:hypothetical protein n=1 Tax=Streptomyces zaomyceticus TaxID=68286 RepID=UPI003724AD51